MWVLIRLLLAVSIGAMKYGWRRTRIGERRDRNGVDWVLTQRRNKSRVIATRFGVPLGRAMYFSLTKKRAWDRWFLSMGFSREIRTGDAEFDAAVYVAGDHPALEPVLQADAEVRAALLSLLAGGAKEIYCDGRNLWVSRSGNTPPSDEEIGLLAKVRDTLLAVPAESFAQLSEGFTNRARLISAMVWGAALYAVPGFFEAAFHVAPLYFEWGPVFIRAAGMLLILWVALVALARLWLQGSTRAHRVLTENFFGIVFCLPVFAVFAVSDLNIQLDRSMPTVRVAHVQQVYTTLSHSRSGTHTHYHVALSSRDAAEQVLPLSFEVPHAVYADVRLTHEIAVAMRAGALGVPWVQDVRAD